MSRWREDLTASDVTLEIHMYTHHYLPFFLFLFYRFGYIRFSLLSKPFSLVPLGSLCEDRGKGVPSDEEKINIERKEETLIPSLFYFVW